MHVINKETVTKYIVATSNRHHSDNLKPQTKHTQIHQLRLESVAGLLFKLKIDNYEQMTSHGDKQLCSRLNCCSSQLN